MSSKKLIAAAVVAALACTGAASASAYSLTGDFSAVANPSGSWSYGWLDELGGTFTAYDVPEVHTAGGTIQTWHDPETYALGTPSVWNNSSASSYVASTVNYLPGWAGFHPGQQNQLSVFRFTTQTAGTYALSFDFQGADVHGTSADVHIYAAGHDLFSANVDGYGDATRQSFSGTVFLNAGQNLDIAVGYGSNASFWYDSTAVRGSIAAVPEPETYAMLLAGLGLLGIAARRRESRIGT